MSDRAPGGRVVAVVAAAITASVVSASDAVAAPALAPYAARIRFVPFDQLPLS